MHSVLDVNCLTLFLLSILKPPVIIITIWCSDCETGSHWKINEIVIKVTPTPTKQAASTKWKQMTAPLHSNEPNESFLPINGALGSGYPYCDNTKLVENLAKFPFHLLTESLLVTKLVILTNWIVFLLTHISFWIVEHLKCKYLRPHYNVIIVQGIWNIKRWL